MKEVEFFDRVILPAYTEKLRDFFMYMFDGVTGTILNPSGTFGSMLYYCQYREAIEFIHFEFLDHYLRRYDDALIPRALVLTSRVIQPHFFNYSVDNLPQCFKESYEFVYYLDNVHKETDEFNRKMFFKEVIHSFGLINSYIEFEKVKGKKFIEILKGEEVF